MKKTNKIIVSIMMLAILFISHGCASMKKASEGGDASLKPNELSDNANTNSYSDENGDVNSLHKKAKTAGIEALIATFENTNIYFDFDKFSLSPDAVDILRQKSVFLNEHDDIDLKIEGNCDERGTAAYNLALGERRAKAAKDFLVTSGVAANRINTVSYGDEKPLDPSHTEAAWAKNRNARFVITNK